MTSSRHLIKFITRYTRRDFIIYTKPFCKMATINLDKKLISQKLEENDIDFIINLLKNEFKLIPPQEPDENPHTKTPSDETYEVLECLLQVVKNKLPSLSDEDVQLAHQCFHSLRNVVVRGDTDFDLAENTIMPNTFEIFKCLMSNDSKVWKDCLKKLMQCLCNILNVYKGMNYTIWENYIPYFDTMLDKKECSTEVLIFMNNIFSFFDFAVPTDVEYLSKVVDLFDQNETEVQLVLEKMIAYDAVTNNFVKLPPKQSILVLEVIRNMIESEIEEIPEDLATVLCDSFKKKSDCILKTVTDYLNDIEPREVSKLLEIVVILSGHERHMEYVQGDKSLLINVLFLLRSMHAAGKENKNDFTPLDKLSDYNSQDTSMEAHPAYGFKANLVRMICNMVSDCKENQDTVRETEGIALLMDCCKIDARNPLIMQWAILAIRNLCKSNAENQKVISQMTKVGVVDSSTLREMGMVLSDDGSNKISMVPYKGPK